MRTVLVSGATRGIGREICLQLARDHGCRVLLGARDLDTGEAVAREIGATAVELDVTDPASIERLAGELDGLDVLVNNAGIAVDSGTPGIAPDWAKVDETLETNLFGAWRLTVAVAPLLRHSGHGRIVNLSSGMGALSEMGTGSPGYRLSKVALNALTVIWSQELAPDGVLVNAACPGWVATDMGGPGARRTVPQGADTPVWLATLPDDGPTGGFFRDRQKIPF